MPCGRRHFVSFPALVPLEGDAAGGYPAVERTLCEVPCADDRDCPEGFFCQGRCQVGEAGLPDNFCLENI
jgi:hypothetical protein